MQIIDLTIGVLAYAQITMKRRRTATEEFAPPQATDPQRSNSTQKTYRIRGIPLSCDFQSLSLQLKRILTHSGDGSKTRAIRSLALAATLRDQVATVDFDQEPSLFQGQGKDQWSLPARDDELYPDSQSSGNLTFDTHFKGLTPLHTAQTAGGNSTRTDIVSVCGLGGHAFGSFKERGGTYMWLRDALPSWTPAANIWTYGFESTVASSKSVQTIDDIASGLVSSLRGIMHTAAEPRRLILIGHSLGGLVVKQALIRLDEQTKIDSDVSKALCGLLFFGVPNQGMAHQSLLAMCENGPNEPLLRSLGPNSEVIRIQRGQFSKCPAAKGCKTYCFYETGLSPTAVKNDKGKWELTGPDDYLVTSESATHFVEGVTSVANTHAINSSHSEMVKFRPYDQDAETVFRILVDNCSDTLTEENSSQIQYMMRTRYYRGLSLMDAPIIDDSLFFGRDEELKRMKSFLLGPQKHSDRRVLVLGGMGGVGKTQIALRYAKTHQSSYSSVFWLDATSEVSLIGSFRRLVPHIFRGQDLNQLKDQELWIKLSSWLSEAENNTWLLLYDNYDDLDQYPIQKYWPINAHGSIIITSRQPDQVLAYPIIVKPLGDIEESLQILAARSGRLNILDDIGARQLAQRLNGLPLALATAGAFLNQSAVSVSKYLEQYEKRWRITPGLQSELADYQTRTLYTTWDLSLIQIEHKMPQAVNLLTFLAYLNHQDIWYDLFRIDEDPEHQHPQWFRDIATDEFTFEEMMAILVRFCLVESHVQTGSYSLHVCVHDWTFYRLNSDLNHDLYRLAFECISRSYVWHDTPSSWMENKRLFPHLQQLLQWRDLSIARPDDFHTAGALFEDQDRLDEAEQMYTRALQGKEKALGPDHTSTLNTINDLGLLYSDRGKLEEAEQMYTRALQGYKKTLGPDHTLTLTTVSNLGILYRDQGKLEEAEQIYTRALQGKEKALGPDHTSTLSTVNNLGLLYSDQGKLEEAEQMYTRALHGYMKALGPDHTSTLNTINNIGILYSFQGKLEEAEQMCTRALQGKEKALGPDHTSTLNTVNNLGLLYSDQGKLEEAEQMYTRALQGYKKTLGPDHTSTLTTVNNLRILYREQGKLEEAEEMYTRAL